MKLFIISSLIFITLGKPSVADFHLSETNILQIKPEALEAYGKAELYLKEGRQDEAVKELRRAVELNPPFASAHNKLGEIYMSRSTPGNRALAMAYFKKALSIDMDNPLYRFNLGLLYKDQGFDNLAEKEFKRVVELDSLHTEAYYNLGLLYEEELLESSLSWPFRNEDFKKTLENYQKALGIDPNHRGALFHLGFVYLDFGRDDTAIDLFTRILDKNPDDMQVHLFLGLAYHEIGNEEESLRQFNDALDLMDPEERSVCKSIDQVVPKKDRDLLASLQSSDKNVFINGFWNSRDPLYLTGERAQT